MNHRVLVLTVGSLLLAAVGDAHAQYGYPAGYGGYGWGGWGSTPQSALARGLGAFSFFKHMDWKHLSGSSKPVTKQN
jgi:hypothetical protein